MIIHFHTGTAPDIVGTGKWVNTSPPISPLIDTATFANWPAGLDINTLFAGNHLTNASPVLEHFFLANGQAPVYPNPPDPRLGFGHGIVAHKRAHINDCAVIGFPGDGIRLVGTTGPHQFLEGLRIWAFYKYVGGKLIFNPPDPNHSGNDDPPPLPPNRILIRYTEYSQGQQTINKNLYTNLGINFIRLDNSTELADTIELNNFQIEYLQGADPSLEPYLEVTGGAAPSSVGIKIFTNLSPSIPTAPPDIPYGVHPMRIKANFVDENFATKDAVSQTFYLYVCDNISNAYPYSVYTNVNTSRLYNVSISKCGRHGIYTALIDSNASIIVGAVFKNNGGWGVYENSGLGNTYIGCHSAGNALGAYYTNTESDVNRNLFVGCSGEGVVQLETPAQWIGSSSEQVASYTPQGYMRSGAAVLNSQGIFPLFRQKIRFNNIANLIPNLQTGPPAGQGVFFDAGGESDQIAGFGNLQEKDWDLALSNLPVNDTDHDISYAFVKQGLDAGRPLALSGLFSKHLPPGMPWLPFGFFISQNNITGNGPRVRVTVGSGAPKAEPVYWNGLYVKIPDLSSPTGESPLLRTLGNIGDIHINTRPQNTEQNKYVAYVCTAPFQYNADAVNSINAVWKPFWLIDF